MSPPIKKDLFLLIPELLEEVQLLREEVAALKTKHSRTFDIEELSNRTGYSINTLYSKIKLLKKDTHYFKPNGGKLFFDESAVDFLVKGENSNGKSIRKERQPICLDNFLAQ